MNLKKLEKYWRVNLLGMDLRLMKNRIYRAAVSQRLRNTAIDTHSDYVILFTASQGKNGYANAPQFYVIWTLLVFYNFLNKFAHKMLREYSTISIIQIVKCSKTSKLMAFMAMRKFHIKYEETIRETNVNGKIILKWIAYKHGVKSWICVKWLKTCPTGEL